MTEFDRQLLALALVSLYVVWVGKLLWKHNKHRLRPNDTDKTDFLVAYASQTGNAQALAEMYAKDKALYHDVALLPLSSLTLSRLQQVKRALFVVSTYGHGEPPDNGRSFFRILTKANISPDCLSSVIYDVVALGDSQYPQFCAFGEQLHQQLQACGAKPASSITRLDHAKGETGSPANIKNNDSAFSSFKLTSRQQLNHGPGHPLFDIRLSAEGSDWQAGDILDVLPQNSADAVEKWLQTHEIDGSFSFEANNHSWRARQWLATRQLVAPGPDTDPADLLTALPALTTRSYTIASIPEEGTLRLIVRRQVFDNERLGIASGWLTKFAQENTVIKGRIRVNPICHLPVGKAPLLLIGAGSGLAGLRAQFAKFTDPSLAVTPSLLWVIYGEREPHQDDIVNKALPLPHSHANEIRIDSVFSRCPGRPQYVQDKLLESGEEIRKLIKEGLQIYVCGSYEGMGESVHEALTSILGEDNLQRLTDHHRYHRDIY